MPDMSRVRLHEAVAAAAPITSVSVGTWGDPAAVRVDFADAATPEQRAAADAAVAAFDWSPEAHAAWELAQSTTAALSWLAGSMDPTAVLLRVVLRDLYTITNDERESRGLTRVLEPATVARLLSSATAGGGAPLTLP